MVIALAVGALLRPHQHTHKIFHLNMTACITSRSCESRGGLSPWRCWRDKKVLLSRMIKMTATAQTERIAYDLQLVFLNRVLIEDVHDPLLG